MANKVVSFFTLLILSVNVHGQTNEIISSIKRKIQSADSVVLISHIIAEGYCTKPDMEIGIEKDSVKLAKYNKENPPCPRFLIHKKINPEIVLESFKLDSSKKIELSKILLRQVLIKEWAPTKCDEPRHTILIYKNNNLSYIDICFTCFHIHPSKDIVFWEGFLDNKKWKDLSLFFKENGISQLLKDDE